MPKKLKKIPQFKSEREEQEFWQRVDSTDYVDYSHAKNWQFPNLKLTSKPITLRLPLTLLNRLKLKAHRMGMPYQSLIKQMLFRGLMEKEA